MTNSTNTQRVLASVMSVAFATVIVGCSKSPDVVASPACADLAKVTDPAQKAELLKKCPRAGGEFKASPKKDY